MLVDVKIGHCPTLDDDHASADPKRSNPARLERARSARLPVDSSLQKVGPSNCFAGNRRACSFALGRLCFRHWRRVSAASQLGSAFRDRQYRQGFSKAARAIGQVSNGTQPPKRNGAAPTGYPWYLIRWMLSASPTLKALNFSFRSS